MKKDVYVIDYSTDDDQMFCVFELQRFNSSNNHYWSGVNARRDAYSFRRGMSQEIGRELYDLPRYLDSEKYMQRILLQQNKKTRGYNPDFLVINRDSDVLSKSDIERLSNFYNLYAGKIIIKSAGCLGTGNIFCRDITFEEFIEHVKENIRLGGGRPFVIEQERMLSSAKKDQSGIFRKHDHNLGIYRRDIVLSEKSGDLNLQHFEAYNYFCNMRHTTDNHDHDKKHTPRMKGYLTDSFQAPQWQT